MKQHTNIAVIEDFGNYSRVDISGISILLDNDMLPHVMKYRWYLDRTHAKKHNLFYFKANLYRIPESNPIRYKMVSLHRYVLGAIDYDGKFVVDHINKDTTDNRKENLRLVTNRENSLNSRKVRPQTTEVGYFLIDSVHKNKNKRIFSNESKIENDEMIQSIFLFNNNTKIIVFTWKSVLYKLCILNNVHVSKRNKFGYPGLSYDKQHKKIVIIKDKKKFGFYSDITEALKKAYELYNIEYSIKIIE